jgi:hypothetical protein
MSIASFVDAVKPLVRKVLRLQRAGTRLIDCGVGQPVIEEDVSTYRKLGLTPVRLGHLPVEQLQCAFTADFEEVLRPFFVNEEGESDRSIRNTPLFKLLRYYHERGFGALEKNFRELDYYKYFMSFNKVGHKTSFFDPNVKEPVHFDDQSIWNKIRRFIHVYESVVRFGYHGGPYEGRWISVLKVPFVVSRFGAKVDYKPYEIFVGHHRATCLAALGQENIEVLLLDDTRAVGGVRT